jgi:hypothetical protein
MKIEALWKPAVPALAAAAALAALPAGAQDVSPCGPGFACTAQVLAVQQLQGCANPPAGLPPDVCRVDARDEHAVIQLVPQPQGRYLMLFANPDGSFEARATVLRRRVDDLLHLIRGLEAMGGDGVARIAERAVVTVRNADGSVHRFEAELGAHVAVSGGSIHELLPAVKN